MQTGEEETPGCNIGGRAGAQEIPREWGLEEQRPPDLLKNHQMS